MSSLRDNLTSDKKPTHPPLYFPAWKYALVAFVFAFGLLYAFPNLYPDDPAVQVTGAKASIEVTQALADEVQSILKEKGFTARGLELLDKSVLVRFKNTEEQLKAKDVLQQSLGEELLLEELSLLSS